MKLKETRAVSAFWQHAWQTWG